MKKKLILTFIIILNFVLVSGQSKTNDLIDTETIVDIEVATFKFLFENNASSLKKKANVYFIGINDTTNKTLNNVILKLRKVNSKVKDVKEFEILNLEEKTKIKFLLFNIDKITFENGKAYVSCGYYEGSLSSSGNVITLVKKRKKWKVIMNEMLWISAIPKSNELLS